MGPWLAIVYAALATFVAAQSVPSCASSCLDANSQVGGCQPLDTACFCTSQEFVNTLSCCLQSSCAPSELVVAISAAQAYCKSANVTNVEFPGCVSENGTLTAVAYSSSSTTATSIMPTTSPASSTTSTASMSNTALPISSASTSSTALPTSTPPPQSGLSLGAEVGIGVGAGIVALAFISLAAFFLLRRNRRAAAVEWAMSDRHKLSNSTDSDEKERIAEMSTGRAAYNTHELE